MARSEGVMAVMLRGSVAGVGGLGMGGLVVLMG